MNATLYSTPIPLRRSIHFSIANWETSFAVDVEPVDTFQERCIEDICAMFAMELAVFSEDSEIEDTHVSISDPMNWDEL